jgi:polyisoprenoid-binding protein YceI
MEKTVLKKYLRAKSVLPVYFLLMAHTAFGQLHPVAKESNIHFSLRNFGFKTGGTLAAPEGDIIFNPDELTKSSFQITIKSESINTDNDSRDKHLRDEDYFNVKNYPLIRFVSDNIRAGGKKGEYETVGKLTIKNKTKDITIPFTSEKSGNGWLFSGSFKMNRRDFDIGGSSTISNELTVDIKVTAR